MHEPEDRTPPQPTPRKSRRRPARERLLATAEQLFYQEGLFTSGIDRVLEQAGVAKGTLYGNFRSKDELIDAYLERRHQHTMNVLQEIETSGGAVHEQIDAVFDHLVEQEDGDGFRGCAFVIAAAEMPSPDKPGMRWAQWHKRAAFDCFQRIFTIHRFIDPAELAEQLSILYDGALVTAVIRPESNAIERAREMTHRIVNAARLAGS